MFQVSTLDPESAGSQSEPLVVSTHVVHQESAVTIHFATDRQPQLLVALAVAILLLATLVTTWRWQHRLSLPHSKFIDEEIGTPNLYRGMLAKQIIFQTRFVFVTKMYIDNHKAGM